MIYFIQSGTNGPIKVGYTSSAVSVGRRLSALQVGSHARLSVIYTMNGGRDTEKRLHGLLAPYGVGGEWFEYDPAMNAIERHMLNPMFPDRPVMRDPDGNGGMLVSSGASMRRIYGENASSRP